MVPSSAYIPTGFHMIRAAHIKNFRSIKTLDVAKCTRINVIVGDNGCGKTALLESLFMPLGNSSEVANRIRQWRGLDLMIQGFVTPGGVEQALFGDLFYRGNSELEISIRLEGDGPLSRSLLIGRSPGVDLPLQGGWSSQAVQSPIRFRWTDSTGQHRESILIQQGVNIHFVGTEERVPESYFFPSSVPLSSYETATRFSDLSRAGNEEILVESLRHIYPAVTDIKVEIVAGTPVLYCKLGKGQPALPLGNISGAINRLVSVFIAVARPKSVVFVDEIENGVFYSRQKTIWSILLDLARRMDAQLFVTTHSMECLRALRDAAGTKVDDISLWRIEGTSDGPMVTTFNGKTFAAGIEQQVEMRG